MFSKSHYDGPIKSGAASTVQVENLARGEIKGSLKSGFSVP